MPEPIPPPAEPELLALAERLRLLAQTVADAAEASVLVSADDLASLLALESELTALADAVLPDPKGRPRSSAQQVRPKQRRNS